MTFRACRRAGFVTRLLFCLMAIDTQAVHDSFGAELTGFFKPGQGTGLLWKQRVTDVAVSKPLLMATVREWHRALGTGFDLDIFRSFVFNGQTAGGYKDTEDHSRDPLVFEHRRLL